MWGFINPMIPAFERAKGVASHIPVTDEAGTYTAAMFAEDFPQFFSGAESIPAGMLEQFVTLANKSVLPSAWGDWWRYAAGLFTAHWAALYLKTYNDGTQPGASVAAASGQTGLVASATLGDTSISYDNTAINAGTVKWGTWNATIYGSQLATLARSVGIGGMYVI